MFSSSTVLTKSQGQSFLPQCQRVGVAPIIDRPEIYGPYYDLSFSWRLLSISWLGAFFLHLCQWKLCPAGGREQQPENPGTRCFVLNWKPLSPPCAHRRGCYGGRGRGRRVGRAGSCVRLPRGVAATGRAYNNWVSVANQLPWEKAKGFS